MREILIDIKESDAEFLFGCEVHVVRNKQRLVRDIRVIRVHQAIFYVALAFTHGLRHRTANLVVQFLYSEVPAPLRCRCLERVARLESNYDNRGSYGHRSTYSFGELTVVHFRRDYFVQMHLA